MALIVYLCPLYVSTPYRDAHCVTVGFAFRGGAYQDDAEGKCVNYLTGKRTVELKQLSDSLTH